MNSLNPQAGALMDRLAADLPQLRADHPDDFWLHFQLRCDEVLDHTPPDELVLARARIDELLIANNLGPADPGA
ncbi:MAG TPA: hypothetical protein VD865_05000 [Stenotrophomonas sp.]|nr:hypothetical protein [Stenotrophomonas sp.]